VPNERVVEVDEFETANPALRGEMTITLADTDGGTDVLVVHDGLPPGLSASDNEVGWRMAFDKLAELVEAGSTSDYNTADRHPVEPGAGPAQAAVLSRRSAGSAA